MSAFRLIRRLRDLIDVDTTGVADGDALTFDAGSETWIPGAGGGGGADDQNAAEVPFTPAGNIAASNVQTAIQELDTEKAATSHAHAGEDITSGTVADARIASTIARDSEVTAAISAHEGASDPHPTYTTAAELSSAVTASEAGQVRDGDAAGGVLGGTYPNPAFAADMATQAELDAHVNDTSAAHAASAVSASSATLSGTGTDVQAVLEELDNLLDDHSGRHEDGGADEISIAGLSGTSAALQAHLDDTSDAHDASAISAVSTTLVGTATDVQGVLEELDNGIADHLADTSAAHAASAIGFTPAGTIAATDVQAALEEVATEASGGGVPSIIIASRSSNTILGTADKGKFIDCTAAFTQTLDAAATLGAGWWVDIRNATTDGSSVLTLDPNSSELIDGATTLHMWSGEVRRVICTGTAFVTIMLSQGLGLYAQTTTTLSSYSGSEASSTNWLTLGAQTYDAVLTCIEVNAQFSCNGSLIVTLWDGATELCRFSDARAGTADGKQMIFTPSAGSHTYAAKVFGNSGGAMDAASGSAGASTYPPAYLRATKV